MKQIIFLFSLTFLLASHLNTFAQRGEGHKERWDKFRNEKIAFLTTNLDLTPEEAQKFWPVYNQMDKAKSEAQQKRRQIEQKVREAEESLSDEDIVKLTREFAGNMQKEGELMAKYNEEFLKILPAKKVLQLYKSESEFRMYMFKKYRDQHRKDRKECP